MEDVDQRGFDNPRSGHLTARQAATFLGVKVQTLYAYASRGLVESIRGEIGRPRRYRRTDLEQLRARRDARSGHGPVAASALRWGEPVLESALTAIGDEGPKYRGHLAVKLAEDNVPFESVAELLWTGVLPETAPHWSVADFGLPAAAVAALVERRDQPLSALALAIPAWAARDRHRADLGSTAVLPKARVLVRRMAAALALSANPRRVSAALAEKSVARVLLRALGADRSPEVAREVNRVLVLCADHELNVSCFAARVAASAGADLYGCMSAALATFCGSRQGGATEQVEALIAEIRTPQRAEVFVRERIRRGEIIEGFGHRLYRHGDPRATLLHETARQAGSRDPGLRTLVALVEACKAAEYGAPNLDLGLVAMRRAIGLPHGSATLLFAIGRIAGWVAHAMEQQAAGFLLRPRARYVGV